MANRQVTIAQIRTFAEKMGETFGRCMQTPDGVNRYKLEVFVEKCDTAIIIFDFLRPNPGRDSWELDYAESGHLGEWFEKQFRS